MTQEAIAKAVKGARKHLEAHPQDGPCTDSFAHAKLGSGLRLEVRGPAGQLITTDMPEGLGGEASAPSPGWLMRAAAAACTATVIGFRAAELGIALDRLEVRVTSRSDDCGMIGAGKGIPPGPLNVSMQVEIASRVAGEGALREIVSWAVAHSPVADAIGRAVPMDVAVAVG